MEPPLVVVTCALCRQSGYAGIQIAPYSIAYGVKVWLHINRCSEVARDPEWREAFVRDHPPASETANDRAG